MFAENLVDVAEIIQSAKPISITSHWWKAALNIVIVIVFAQSSWCFDFKYDWISCVGSQ